MNGNNGVPLLFGHGHERLIPQNTSIGDQDVDTAKGVQGGLDESVAVLSRAHRSRGLTTS